MNTLYACALETFDSAKGRGTVRHPEFAAPIRIIAWGHVVSELAPGVYITGPHPAMEDGMRVDVLAVLSTDNGFMSPMWCCPTADTPLPAERARHAATSAETQPPTSRRGPFAEHPATKAQNVSEIASDLVSASLKPNYNESRGFGFLVVNGLEYFAHARNFRFVEKDGTLRTHDGPLTRAILGEDPAVECIPWVSDGKKQAGLWIIRR